MKGPAPLLVPDMNMHNHEDLFEAADIMDDNGIDQDVIRKSVSAILKAVGEDPEREGLLNTPTRVAKSYDELLAGYRVDPYKLINGAMFEVEYDEMVIVRDIEFYSL
jgi:GTP cyclohydrolase I